MKMQKPFEQIEESRTRTIKSVAAPLTNQIHPSTQPAQKPNPNMATKPIPQPMPEDPDDSDAMMERLADAATGADGYWPDRVKQAIAKAGFAVRSLEREAHHPVWIVWLNVGSGDLPADRKLAVKLIRKALAEAGLRIHAGELDVVERPRGRAKVVFVFGTQLPPIDLMGI
jgi:hypothetical protein